MEETPVRPSTQQGGKRITYVEAPLLPHCVNAVLVHSIRVGKLPEQVAAEGLKLGIRIEINGTTFTTGPTTAVPEGATHDPITGKVQRSAPHGGRHGPYAVRLDNVDVLLPGSRRRSERYGKPPAFIANPRELREGVKVTLHSMDATHTIFGSTICVCSGESSFMSHPRGEATVDFRVFSCEDGVVNMEPLYNRTTYVKTYLGEDPREMIQSKMDAERAKRKETAKLRVERVSLDEVEALELDNATDSSCLEAELPEASPYMVEGGDGKVVVPPTTLRKVHQKPKNETAHRIEDNDDADEEEGEEQKDSTWVAEASHVAVGGSFSTASASGSPDFRSGARLPLPESTQPFAPLEKENASKGEETKRITDTIVTLPLGGGPPPHLGNEGAEEEGEEVEEEAEWEREAQSTEAYTQALATQVDQIRVQSAPHFPDRLTSVMRSLVPCNTKEKLDAAFELYDVEKKGLLTREQLVHFCRAHQPYADWCADDDTLLLSLAPYIPSSLLEVHALTVTGGGEGAPEEVNAYGLSRKEELKEEIEGDASGVIGEGSSSHRTGKESAISFPRLNVNYLYYHPENRSAPLQINREFFDVIALRLAGS